MFEKRNVTRSVIAIIIIVGLVAAGLILTYVFSNNDTDTQIVLPSVSPEIETEPLAEVDQPDVLLSVSPDNVREVLSTVNRPSSYHRVLSMNLISNDSIKSESAEIWVSDGNYYYEINNDGTKQHILIADETVSIWYNIGDGIHTFSQSSYFSVDDLVGIPTYEDIIDMDPELITAADYVTGTDGASFLYVECTTERGDFQYRYWVSLETGLLAEAVSIYRGETVYSMKETFMQQLPATDSEFDNRFIIPEA